MRTTKRRWLIAGAIGAPAVAATLWFAWLPGRIANEVAQRAAARGWELELGGVWPGLGSVELEEIHATRDGIDVTVDAVEIDTGPLSLAISGTDAIEEVVVRDGTVQVRSEVFADRESADAGTPESDDGRRLRLEGVALELVDEHGTLARAEVSGELARAAITVDAEDCVLGERPSHQATAERLHLEATRDPELGWQVANLRVQGAELHIGAVPRAEGIEAPSDEPRAEGEVPADEPREIDASGEVPATRERIASFLAGGAEVADPTGDPEPEDAPASADRVRDGPTGEETGLVWVDRIADGAILEAAGVSVTRTGRSGEPENVLDELMTRIERDQQRFEIRARADGSGGSLRAHLRAGWSPPSLEGTLGVTNLPFDVLLPFLPALPWHRPGEARLTVDLALDAPSPDQVDVEGSASLIALSFDHPRLAASPVREIAFGVEGQASFRPLEGRLTFTEAEIRAGRAEATMSGELVGAGGTFQHVELHARLAPTSCDDAVGAIPNDLLAEAAGFSWDGSMSGRLDLEVAMDDLEDTVLEVDITNGCRFQTVPAVADLRRVRATFVHRVQEPDGSVFEMATGPGTPGWTPMAQISPYVVHAIVGHEDGGFFGHEGFAVYAIRDALKRNLREGRYVVGASTISMQLAKNLFLHREKTLARKVQEVLLTWWLESALSKEEILELYLNIIEYGPGVYGITAAAQHYFGRTPAELSPAESVYLACVLPNPKGLQASYDQGSLTSSMRGRMTRFIEHLHARNRIDAAARDYAIGELAGFHFHQEGAVPSPRQVPGGAAALPVATATAGELTDEELSYEEEDGWVDAWAPMEEPPPAPEGG